MRSDWLDTASGHIAVSLLLIGIGATFAAFKIPKSEDVIVAGLTLVARCMIGGKQEPPIAAVETRTTQTTVTASETPIKDDSVLIK